MAKTDNNSFFSQVQKPSVLTLYKLYETAQTGLEQHNLIRKDSNGG